MNWLNLSCGIFSFYIQLYHVEVNPLEPRRRRIRTAIQAPKASVLPLHYVLYIEASWNMPHSLRRPLCRGTKAGTRTQIVRLSVANFNQLNYLGVYKTVFSIFVRALPTELPSASCARIGLEPMTPCSLSNNYIFAVCI